MLVTHEEHVSVVSKYKTTNKLHYPEFCIA